MKYRDAIFLSDASGLRMTIGQAMQWKKLKSDRGIPDLFIMEPKRGYHGMMLELKKNKDEVFKKNGEVRQSTHIQEQKAILDKLTEKGYCAVWGMGFEHSRWLIDWYLGGANE